jgi:aspartyl-tRNA synthetase
MTHAPAPVENKQLRELGIRLREEAKRDDNNKKEA